MDDLPTRDKADEEGAGEADLEDALRACFRAQQAGRPFPSEYLLAKAAAAGTSAPSLAFASTALSDSPAAATGGEPGAPARLPARFGRYEIVSVLGEGGFGTAYHAYDRELQREVVLKIFHPEVTRRDGERFMAEARASSGLHHPSIVTVYDILACEAWRGIVYQYVAGVNLRDWRSANAVSSRDAALLVAELASALALAHQQQVCHLDIKLDNVLMDCERDSGTGMPFPMLIDFGLSARIGGFNRGGTARYSSPEQLAGQPAGPLTDLYAMGLVLVELVSGDLPLDFPQAPPPGSDEGWQALGAERLRVIERRLTRDVPADLRAICRKCIQPTPAGRYASARDLETDLRHFVAGRAVSVRPRRLMERTIRLARAHPGKSLAAAVACLAVAAIFWLSTQTIHQLRQRERLVAFITNDIIAALDPFQTAGNAHSQQQLEHVDDRVQREFSDQPATLARFNHQLGLAWLEHRRFDQAIARLKYAYAIQSSLLAGDDREQLLTAAELGRAYDLAGRPAEAIGILSLALQAAETQLTATDPIRLKLASLLAGAYETQGNYPAALRMFEQVAASCESHFGEHHEETLRARQQVAFMKARYGRIDEAIQDYESLLVLQHSLPGDQRLERSSILHNLGTAYRQRADYSNALRCFQEAYKIRKERFSADHPDTWASYEGMALVLADQNELDQARAIWTAAAEWKEKALPQDHPSTLTTWENLASLARRQGDGQTALAMRSRIRAAREREFGSQHPETVFAMEQLAVALSEAQKFKEARSLLVEAAETVQLNVAKFPDAWRIHSNLAQLHEVLGEWSEAERSYQRSLDAVRTPGRNPLDAAQALYYAADFQLGRKDYAQAEGFLRESVQLCSQAAPDSWTKFNRQLKLGIALVGQSKLAEAEPILQEGWQGLAAHVKEIPASSRAVIRASCQELAELYQGLGASVESERWQSCLQQMENWPTTP